MSKKCVATPIVVGTVLKTLNELIFISNFTLNKKILISGPCTTAFLCLVTQYRDKSGDKYNITERLKFKLQADYSVDGSKAVEAFLTDNRQKQLLPASDSLHLPLLFSIINYFPCFNMSHTCVSDLVLV